MVESASAPIVCPKCQSQMLAVSRFGVQIDQCTGCGGIFLDPGELEELAAAEARFYASQQPAAPPPQPGWSQYQDGPGYQPRRGGFLGGLFGEGHGRGYGGHH